MKLTDSRNWNPDCVTHGVGTDWYTDPKRVARRKVDRDRTIDLQRRAREARQKARES